MWDRIRHREAGESRFETEGSGMVMSQRRATNVLSGSGLKCSMTGVGGWANGMCELQGQLRGCYNERDGTSDVRICSPILVR